MVTLIFNRRPTVRVTADGDEIPDVFSIEYSQGFDKKGPSDAKIVAARTPSWVQAWSWIEIDAGATDATTTNRWKGFAYDWPSYALSPRGVTIACRGPLQKAATALVSDESNDVDVPGIDLSNKTAAQQFAYVLDAEGLGAYYSAADLWSTDHLLGSQQAPKGKGSVVPNVWKRNKSGVSFLVARDEVGLGARLVEERGVIKRPAIAPVPGLATVLALQEGVDLCRDGKASHADVEGIFNRVVVTGWDGGDGPVKWIETRAHPRPVPGVPFISTVLPSQLLEQEAEGSHAQGLSCQEVARWWIDVVCQIYLEAEVTTVRDDLFTLTQAISLHAPDRFEIDQPMWLRSLSGSVSRSGGFRQRLSLRAPALAGAGGIGVPTPVGALGFGVGSLWSHA